MSRKKPRPTRPMPDEKSSVRAISKKSPQKKAAMKAAKKK